MKIVLFFLIQTATFQQKIVLIIQFRNNLADLPPDVRKRACFHFGKRMADDGISPLEEPVALLLPDGRALEQLPSPRTVYGEKLLHHFMFSVLPKRRGLAIRVMLSSFSHHSLIKPVLSI